MPEVTVGDLESICYEQSEVL